MFFYHNNIKNKKKLYLMINETAFLYHLSEQIKHRMSKSATKITDLVLEEFIIFALKDSGNLNVIYKSGSHTKGADVLGCIRASIKSGTIDKIKIKISSFRLSRFDNLSNMLDFIDNGEDGQGKNFDFYFVLARKEFKPTKKQLKDKPTLVDEITYLFYIIPANIFTAKNMTWKEVNKGWETPALLNDVLNPITTHLSISKKMSNQLWIELDLESIKKYLKFEITMPISELAKDRFVAEQTFLI